MGFQGMTYTDNTDWKMLGEASSRQTGESESIRIVLGKLSSRDDALCDLPLG